MLVNFILLTFILLKTALWSLLFKILNLLFKNYLPDKNGLKRYTKVTTGPMPIRQEGFFFGIHS